MAISYTVLRGFAREGKWYTRQNAHEVKSLPKADRDDLIERGYIAEQDEGAGDPAETTTTAKKKG
jgi:hypothetical protein